ncbi:13582_t:CDS:2 [Entrophospora sp. SA101]|nr:13582_t:CDS:2 [Entrophospora sp. SA101]
MEEDNIKRVCEEKVDKEEDNAEDIHGEFVLVNDDNDDKLISLIDKGVADLQDENIRNTKSIDD